MEIFSILLFMNWSPLVILHSPCSAQVNKNSKSVKETHSIGWMGDWPAAISNFYMSYFISSMMHTCLARFSSNVTYVSPSDQCRVPLREFCRNEGYQDPNACHRCRCPDGFDGTYCTEVASPVGGKQY